MNPADIALAIGAECLCFRSRRVSRLLTRHYDEALRPVGIQATQLTLMSVVAAAGERGQPMGRLAQVLAMDLTTLSRNLRPLEKGGLIEIARADGDRRVRLARLSEAGAAKLGEALPLWRDAQERLVEKLGHEAAIGLKATLYAAAASAAA